MWALPSARRRRIGIANDSTPNGAATAIVLTLPQRVGIKNGCRLSIVSLGSFTLTSPDDKEEVIAVPPTGVKKGSKRDRQYKDIVESERRRGVGEERAEEIAARTVNKERARSGETRGAAENKKR